jgi:hypothetical protein
VRTAHRYPTIAANIQMSYYSKLNFERLFGRENIVRLSKEKKSELALSEDIKLFLSDTGLPHRDESLKFSLDLRTIPESNNLDKFLIIGVEYDFQLEQLSEKLNLDKSNLLYSYICLNQENESIYSISAGSLHCIVFVNTNIHCLAEALCAYRESQVKVDAKLDDDEFICDEIERLKEKLKKIDPAIFDIEKRLRLTDIEPAIFDAQESWWESVLGASQF